MNLDMFSSHIGKLGMIPLIAYNGDPVVPFVWWPRLPVIPTTTKKAS